jgi:hypothetical protein
VDYSKLVFGDQLARGGDVSTYEYLEGRSVKYTDAGTGLLYFTPKVWLGMALHHLMRPNQSLLEHEARIPRTLSVHGGRRFHIRSNVIKRNKQSVGAAFNYRAQEKIRPARSGDLLRAGTHLCRPLVSRHTPAQGVPARLSEQRCHRRGAGRHGEGLAGRLQLRPHDIAPRRLYRRSHEISVGYEMADKRKRRAQYRKRAVPCAKFLGGSRLIVTGLFAQLQPPIAHPVQLTDQLFELQ